MTSVRKGEGPEPQLAPPLDVFRVMLRLSFTGKMVKLEIFVT